jgi:hypothetical protein
LTPRAEKICYANETIERPQLRIHQNSGAAVGYNRAGKRRTERMKRSKQHLERLAKKEGAPETPAKPSPAPVAKKS